MTVRVTSLKGADAGAYYVDQLPSYYLDASEPAGVWHGQGAGLLGLDGTVSDDEFLRLMAGAHPTVLPSHHLGRAFGEKSVRGYDVTASAPKSVSVLWALGTPGVEAEVLAGHDAAVSAMIGWIESHALTRRRIAGQVATVDTEGIVAAAFRQHTSRALDPQLHTHVVIANRVRSDDGRWLALDARTIMLDQRTLSAIYHAGLRSELTRRLGVAWGPVENGIAEMAAIPEAILAEYSTRATDVARRVDAKTDRFRDTFDREPTPRERWRLEREAVVDSRPSKAHTTDAAALRQEWADRLGPYGTTAQQLHRDVVYQAKPVSVGRVDRNPLIAAAMDALSEKQSSWRVAEITRELAAHLPTVDLPASEAVTQLDRLTRLIASRWCVDLSPPVPEGATLRRDGRPVTESTADRVLTGQAILIQEHRILDWAERRAVHTGASEAAAIDRSPILLSGPQAEVAAAVAGSADLVMVVGPAGTGETTALAPAVAQLHADGRAVFGVAPSAAAAKVLAAETGVRADTIDKLFAEYARHGGPWPAWRLPVGATLIVDEVGMVSTPQLAALAEIADEYGWRVALVGDPRQYSPVGRGGMYEMLVGIHGAIELDQVHRFTQPWEAEASLRLRRGDPSVAAEYERHGRLHGGTLTSIRHDALSDWHRARSAGHRVLLSAPTNDTVIELNHAAQHLRAAHRELDPAGPCVDAGPYRLHLGDEIVTRRNDRTLTTDRGEIVRNRDTFTITAVHGDGGLTASGATGTVTLPPSYVHRDVELGYAQTSHATQGRTVDRSILVLNGPTDVRGIYVPLTRGRDRNDVYIALTGQQTAHDVFIESIGRSWVDQPALARAAQVAQPHQHRPGLLDAQEIRDLFTQRSRLTAMIEETARDLVIVSPPPKPSNRSCPQ